MAELVSDAPGAAEKSKETFEPPMSLAQSVFRHGRNPTPASEKEILDLVTQRQMAPYYARVCACLLYTSPSPRDRQKSRMPSSA